MANTPIFNIHNIPGKAWTTQRIANRLPGWSRARLREDSTFQLIVNPIGQVLDDIYAKLYQVKANYYIPTADTNHIQYAYAFELPPDFEFEKLSDGANGWTWQDPTIVGVPTVGDPVDVTVINKWSESDKFFLPPTRLGSTYLASGVTNEILTETNIHNLGSATISTAQLLDFPGTIWADLDGATIFGGITSRGEPARSALVFTGEPVERDYLDEWTESMFIKGNSELPTKNAWSYLNSIYIENIYGDDATIKLTRGFNKDALREPYGILTTSFEESQLLYQFKNFEYAGNIYPLMQYVLPELADPALVMSGLAERELYYEKVLVDENQTAIAPVIAIERMPFSPWFVVLTAEKLYFYPTSMSHCLIPQYEGLSSNPPPHDSAKLANLLMYNRSHQIELELDVERTWLNLSEDVERGVELITRHISRQRPIIAVRFSYYYFSPTATSTDEPTLVYLDDSGNEITLSTHPTQGWIYTAAGQSHPTDWSNIRFTVNPLLNGVTYAVYVMEVQVDGGNTPTGKTIQKDSLLVHADAMSPVASFDLPNALQNNVTGMTYDHLDRLLVLTKNSQAYELNMFWDYATVNHRRNTLFFREEYAVVSVESTMPWPTSSTSPVASTASSSFSVPPATTPATPTTAPPSIWESLTPLIP